MNNNQLPTKRAYFRSLEKKRLEYQLKLDKAKFDYVVSKVIGEKKLFVRNYSFIFNQPKVQMMSKENISKKSQLQLFDKDNSLRECKCGLSKREIHSPNEYNKKLFKRKLFAEIYQKQKFLPDISSMNICQPKKRNKTQRDQSTSCDPIPSKMPSIKIVPNDKQYANNKADPSIKITADKPFSAIKVEAKNYFLSAGICSINAA